jgi:hypothetical protein
VRLAVLAAAGSATTTTGLGSTLHTNCIGHVSVSGFEYYTGRTAACLQVGQV